MLKKGQCTGCLINIKVPKDYVPEYCCDGRECGCMGLPNNPMLCDVCEEKAFGKRVN